MNRQYSALSGVAIVLIVLNHAVHFSLQVSPVAGGWLKFLIFVQALGGFAVPAFLFISGAFLAYAAREVSLTFVRSSLERILSPYVIWTTAFAAFVVATTGALPSVAAYIKSLFVGYPYHFVPLLVFWYVTAPVVVRLARTRGVALVLAVGIYQALLLWLRLGAGSTAPPQWLHVLHLPVLSTPLADWGVYFPLGLVLSLHSARIKPALQQLRLGAFALTVLCFVVGILNAYNVLSAPWARFVAPLPAMFLLPVIDRGAIPFVRGCEWIGRRSYGIYLTHFVVINLLAYAVTRTGFLIHPAALFPIFFVVTLGMSMIVMDTLARPVATRKLYRFLFGIVPPATGVQRPQARKERVVAAV